MSCDIIVSKRQTIGCLKSWYLNLHTFHPRQQKHSSINNHGHGGGYWCKQKNVTNVVKNIHSWK
jgi:hypothetical protein